MNTSPELRRCPACAAEIPPEAPQGLCPRCLLLGVASIADPVSHAENSPIGSESGAKGPRGRASSLEQSANSRTPTIEELTPAFPQLEILELIGRGGMGFVYKARQLKLDRMVALKILPGHLADQPSFHERFEREARVLAKLQHPRIVGVYDFGEAHAVRTGESTPISTSLAPQPERTISEQSRASASQDASPTFYYLVLEFVDGVNLREAMRAGRFTAEQALAIVPQICEALQYAHSKGVLHRDIKPENILLNTEGAVKITDFGIAKVLGPEIEDATERFGREHASESELAVTRLTATGAVLGTPLYMAPEQLIRPSTVDHRADIFSLGVVFYEMLTGELPMGRFAPPSEKSLVDQRIDEVVMRALAKERELRQQSAEAMKTEVETISSDPHNGGHAESAKAAAMEKQIALGHLMRAQDRSAATGPSVWQHLRHVLWLMAFLVWIPVVVIATLMITYFINGTIGPRSSDSPVLTEHTGPITEPPYPSVDPSTRPMVMGGLAMQPGVMGAYAARPVASDVEPPAVESGAMIEARQLGLIEVFSSSYHASGKQPIKLGGIEDPRPVEPYFSVLARLLESHNSLTWMQEGPNWYEASSQYPCEYISCDRSSGAEYFVIRGYLMPPGAYDFRADNELTAIVSGLNATDRSEIGLLVLRLLDHPIDKSISSATEWQKATLAKHLRLRFVPRSDTDQKVPDECLVVLTDNLRTLFSRTAGQFTRYEFASSEAIKEIRERIGRSSNSRLESGAKESLEISQQAMRQQHWELLLSQMTDDCRDDWIMSILHGCVRFGVAQLKRDAETGENIIVDPNAVKSLNQMCLNLFEVNQCFHRSVSRRPNDQLKTLSEMFDDIEHYRLDVPPIVQKRLELRQETYNGMTDLERRQFRIDIFRAYYSDSSNVATTVLTYLQQLRPNQLIVDFSTVTDLKIVEDPQRPGHSLVAGFWRTKNGKQTPVTLFPPGYYDGVVVSKFRSLTGNSDAEPPVEFLSTLIRALSEPDPPADAANPDRVDREVDRPK